MSKQFLSLPSKNRRRNHLRFSMTVDGDSVEPKRSSLLSVVEQAFWAEFMGSAGRLPGSAHMLLVPHKRVCNSIN